MPLRDIGGVVIDNGIIAVGKGLNEVIHICHLCSCNDLILSGLFAGQHVIAIGNIVGSNIFNILFIVGTTAFVRQVPFDPKFIVDSVVMVVAGIILWAAVLKKEKLTRTGGIVMLLAYLAYFVYLCMKP